MKSPGWYPRIRKAFCPSSRWLCRIWSLVDEAAILRLEALHRRRQHTLDVAFLGYIRLHCDRIAVTPLDRRKRVLRPLLTPVPLDQTRLWRLPDIGSSRRGDRSPFRLPAYVRI
jgi:hypothetical protein